MGSRDHGMVEFGVQIPMAPVDSAKASSQHAAAVMPGQVRSPDNPSLRFTIDFLLLREVPGVNAF